MKKKLIISLTIVFLLILIYIVINRFIPRTDVFLGEYSVSEDRTKIEMNVGVSSSMGYVGRYSKKRVGNALYLTFFSSITGNNTAFGGNIISVELFPQCDSIYFNRSQKKFAIILNKNSKTGEFERVTQ